MLYWLFLLSGGAGLALEVTWSRQLTVALGHEVTAVFATVSSLFGGMALGAALFGSRIRRSDRPEWWYAGLEGVIGLWAILASAGLTPVMLALGAMLGPDPSPLLQGTIHFLAPSVLLLPATAAMGAALPAMESLARRRLHESPIGLVYGWNTLGAVLGVWIATFFLMPLFPLHRLLLGIGAANFLVMGLVLVGTRGRPGIPATERIQPAGRRSTWVGLCLAGFLGISYELAGIRVLSQTLENTVYTFGATVAIFLAGTTMGAFAWHRWRSRLPPARLEPALWIGLSFAVLAGALVLTGIPSAYPWLRERLGDTSLAVFLAETASTGAVFLVPTLFMGALFSQLVEAGTAHGVGWGYAWNNAGAALAAPVTIFLFIPLLGCKGTLAVVAAAYAVPLIGRPLGWACLGLVGLAFLLPWDLRGLNPPPGGSLLAYREGGLASVAVLEQPGGDRTLRVNNRFQMGGTGSAVPEWRQGHIPLLLHPGPERALFLGVGTGITLGSAAEHREVRADGVELIAEMLGLLDYFQPHNRGAGSHPRLRVQAADARRFVRAAGQTYDVIVADVFHPALDGAGLLYTVEHFQAVARRLRPQGLFCQWLPLHQLDLPTLQCITRTFLEVFPGATAWLLHFNLDIPVLGLVSRLPADGSLPGFSERLARMENPAALREAGIAHPLHLHGLQWMSSDQLKAWCGGAPLNLDDHPRVVYQAPRFHFVRDAPSGERLIQMLAWRRGQEEGEPERLPGLQAFQQARDLYLEGLHLEDQKELARAMELYLESAALSLYFTPAYARCVTIISAMASADRERARLYYDRLLKARPDQPLGKRLLESLF